MKFEIAFATLFPTLPPKKGLWHQPPVQNSAFGLPWGDPFTLPRYLWGPRCWPSCSPGGPFQPTHRLCMPLLASGPSGGSCSALWARLCPWSPHQQRCNAPRTCLWQPGQDPRRPLLCLLSLDQWLHWLDYQFLHKNMWGTKMRESFSQLKSQMLQDLVHLGNLVP